MVELLTFPYPASEYDALRRLDLLFSDWQAHMEKHFRGYEDYTVADFVRDGFYPYYFTQKTRVLFVGRESRGLSGANYLDVVLKSYRHSKRIGRNHLNRSKFHRLLLYLAYSLNHDFCDWDSIPWASQIGDTVGTESGVSFAFMNLSKFSNESTSWQTIQNLLRISVGASQGARNFIREQIELLRPHVIVTMNFCENDLDVLGKRSSLKTLDHVAEAYRFDAGANDALLINTFHFSAPRKADRAYYIDPVRSLAKEYSPEFYFLVRAMECRC